MSMVAFEFGFLYHKKVVRLLFLTIFFVLALLPGSNRVIAVETCDIQTNPSPVTTSDEKISATIDTKGLLVEGKKYEIRFEAPYYAVFGSDFEVKDKLIKIDGLLPVFLQSGDGFTSTGILLFQEGKHIISINEPGGKTFCLASFEVKKALKDDRKCSIDFFNQPLTTDKDITVSVKDIQGGKGDSDNYVVSIRRDNDQGKEVKRFEGNKESTLSYGVVLGKYEVGNYFVRVSRQDRIAERLCSAIFRIFPPGSDYIQEIETGGATVPKPPPPCGENPKTAECKTAIGTINVSSPTAFIGTVFSLVLSLAGMGAFGLIVYSGYIFMTSGGDKEKIQGAKETITSAIAGLLFIIFSIVILEIIGVDILKIFSK